MNIRIDYLYRDYANYKQFHSEVLPNKENLSIEAIKATIESKLIEQIWFYPEDWFFKPLHAHPWNAEIDHPLHEIESIEVCDEPSTCTIDIGDLLIQPKQRFKI